MNVMKLVMKINILNVKYKEYCGEVLEFNGGEEVKIV